MSLDKAIEHGKEHRKPYYGAKAIFPSCRNHSGDEYCEKNKLIRRRKDELKAKSIMADYWSEDEEE